MVSKRCLVILAVMYVWLSPVASGAGSPRFVVILEETIEGETPTVPEGQGILETGLLEKGYSRWRRRGRMLPSP